MKNVGKRAGVGRSNLRRRDTLTLMLALFQLVAMVVPASAKAMGQNKVFGTLFYSPQERTAISAARRVVPGAAASSGTTITVGGVVRRDKGKGSAWINGQLVTEGQAVKSAGVPVIDQRDITIEGHRIRVRETVDIESGARVDALPAGSVNVKAGK